MYAIRSYYDAGANDFHDFFTESPDFTPYSAIPVDSRIFEPQKALGISPLVIGIVIGIFYANTLHNQTPEAWQGGITFSAKKILRFAIVFYGFRLTFQEIIDVGMAGFLVSLIMLASTFVITSYSIHYTKLYDKAKRDQVCIQMAEIKKAFDMFKLDNGMLPETEEGIEALISNPDADKYPGYSVKPYMERLPKDPS